MDVVIKIARSAYHYTIATMRCVCKEWALLTTVSMDTVAEALCDVFVGPVACYSRLQPLVMTCRAFDRLEVPALCDSSDDDDDDYTDFFMILVVIYDQPFISHSCIVWLTRAYRHGGGAGVFVTLTFVWSVD